MHTASPGDGEAFETRLQDGLGFSLCGAVVEASKESKESRVGLLRDALPDLKKAEGAGAKQLGEIKLRWDEELKCAPEHLLIQMAQLRPESSKSGGGLVGGNGSLKEGLARTEGRKSLSYAEFGRILAEGVGRVGGEEASGFRILRPGPVSQSPDVLLLAWDKWRLGLIGFQAKALEKDSKWPVDALRKNRGQMEAIGKAVKDAIDKLVVAEEEEEEGSQVKQRTVLTGAVVVGTRLSLSATLKKELEQIHEEMKSKQIRGGKREKQSEDQLVWQDAWAVGEKQDPSLLYQHLHRYFLFGSM
mgnify:CR=1 FL=1